MVKQFRWTEYQPDSYKARMVSQELLADPDGRDVASISLNVSRPTPRSMWRAEIYGDLATNERIVKLGKFRRLSEAQNAAAKAARTRLDTWERVYTGD